jgi:hypothetical protein
MPLDMTGGREHATVYDRRQVACDWIDRRQGACLPKWQEESSTQKEGQ